MHEMSLAENVRQIIEEAAAQQGFNQVLQVTLEIGQLAAVEAEAMAFCFDVVMAGSVAEGAQLELVQTPGRGRCLDCGCEMDMDELYGLCEQCGSPRLSVIAGRVMRVKDLKVI